ncbi:DUF2750 domain-containing protein [Undibacterium sp. 14-3-2]|uniref:DUF2750 domain-containing protein n=1 Tax=Undibacterium sp. 14-3-2 TaxID=2800129 RepID=UPI0019047B09|nr:DUF2750 domain-containing protein [Undibacterium sp. 14-3-2]MBK1891092.1 DUF2750 domain-containing protein [Undibacterium sp. 14-3-2]
MADSYRFSEQEHASVTRLEGSERYEHFVKRVADWQNVWGLKNETGWVSAEDDSGNRGIPVWPHPDYAAACAKDEWAGNQPTPIEVQEFVAIWLPNMANDNVHVAVFPTTSMKGVMVPALQLRDDLQEELADYE